MAGRDDWDRFWADARAADILAVAQRLGARLKNIAANEWAGPCPLCGGGDRFSVNQRKNVFNCRGCEGRGSVIDMVMLVTGCSVIEASELITGEPRPDHSRDETPEEELARLQANNARMEALGRREEEYAQAAATKARRDEMAIADVLDRAFDLEDPRAKHGKAYIVEERGLAPNPSVTRDIKFVESLDYWGLGDNGLGQPVLLATLPAIIAIIRDVSGAIIGIQQTYLDPKEPRKWRPIGSPRNRPKKIRGDKKHGMIRLGLIGECLALGEGWENVLAWHQLGYGPEDVALGAAIDLGNLGGRAMGIVNHPIEMTAAGGRTRMANGLKPDPEEPGVILPDGVRSAILIGDRDSETYSTVAKMMTAAARFTARGLEVALSWPLPGKDFNQMLLDGWTP
jgi:hypothetical protein